MEKAVKVFKMNDCDWYAGRNLEEVKAFVLAETGMPEDEAFDNPGELSDEAMRELRFRHTDGNDLRAKTTVSFAERLAEMVAEGQEFPAFFASTEY
jgi:hypothetical protein